MASDTVSEWHFQRGDMLSQAYPGGRESVYLGEHVAAALQVAQQSPNLARVNSQDLCLQDYLFPSVMGFRRVLYYNVIKGSSNCHKSLTLKSHLEM